MVLRPFKYSVILTKDGGRERKGEREEREKRERERRERGGGRERDRKGNIGTRRSRGE